MAKEKTGYTPQTIRNKNNQVIFNALRTQGPAPVRDLVEASNLSKTAVQRIINNMIDSKIAKCLGKGESTDVGGKRPDVYVLDNQAAYCLCCYFSDKGYCIAAFDIHYNQIAIVDMMNQFDRLSYTETIDHIAASITKTLEEHSYIPARLTGIVFSCSGIVSSYSGTLVNPILHPHWGTDLPFIDDIRARLNMDCPMYLDNSIRYSAYDTLNLEPSFRDQNVVFVNYYRENVGGCVMRRGYLVHGRTGLVGEFGHITTDYTFCEACSCGKTGCIESVVAQSHIVARAKRELPLWPSSPLHNVSNLSLADISNAADSGDPFAKRQMDLIVQQFTTLFYTLHIVFDPDLFVFSVFAPDIPMNYFCTELAQAVNKASLNNVQVPLQINILPNGDFDQLAANILTSTFSGSAHFCFDQFFSHPENFNTLLSAIPSDD